LNASDTPQLGKQLLLPGDGFKVSIVSDDDPDDARHRRWQQTGLFFAALFMFGITFLVTGWLAFFAAGDSELKKSALSIFVTLAGALGGFLGGRASK
jgi:hypothetical protein